MYKLTDQNMQTYNGFQWKLGEWQEAKGDANQPLCTDGWLHCYQDPLLALFMNPIHANFKKPRLFEVETNGEHKSDNRLKEGFRRIKLIREISIPKITVTQQIAFGILCVKQVYGDKSWNKWADNWLSGKDGNADAADAAYAAADAAITAADAVAATAADVAAYAAAYAADAADVAADAAITAADAAATAATYAAAEIDFIKTIKKAMTY